MEDKMNKTRKVLALLLVVCMAAGLFCACGGGGSEAESTDNAEHEPITIIDAQRDYTALVELVHEKYPEINIEIIPYRGSNMSAYMKHQLESGCVVSDIYSTTQAWDSTYQEKYLIDLSKYDISNLYNEARLSEYTVDGSLYLLPYDYSIVGILYNKSLFERLGIADPQSFQQLRDETVPALRANGVKVANTLLDLPGAAFQYFFDISAGQFMNSVDGRSWRKAFADVDSDTFASGDENIKACVDLFQQWIDCGMLSYEEEISDVYSGVVNDFEAGNVGFIVGTVNRFTQYDDGTGDQYGIMPFLSMDGTQNTYITSPGRFYGLNKELEEEGNEQKLEDALHVLEVISSNEGYLAIHGENSTNMCSIKEFKVSEDSPYNKAVELVSKGKSMNLVYTGWDSYLVSFGEALCDWIKGEKTGEEAIAALDETKKSVSESGVKSYGTVTEELDLIQTAQLVGQMYMDATGADAALISYNVYSPKVKAIQENSSGVNGMIIKGDLTDEYITIFLPTGWYGTIPVAELTGAEIAETAHAGCDVRGIGFSYPYVFMTADGKELKDDETYLVAFAGYDSGREGELGITDTGLLGLDVAKAYFEKLGEISTKTLDDSLVQYIGTLEDLEVSAADSDNADDTEKTDD